MAGEFVVLVGPSGSGKSTAIGIVTGLDEISEGVVVIGDRVVKDLTPKELDIDIVFPSRALHRHMNVHANRAYTLKMRRVLERPDHDKSPRSCPDPEYRAFAAA